MAGEPRGLEDDDDGSGGGGGSDEETPSPGRSKLKGLNCICSRPAFSSRSIILGCTQFHQVKSPATGTVKRIFVCVCVGGIRLPWSS